LAIPSVEKQRIAIPHTRDFLMIGAGSGADGQKAVAIRIEPLDEASRILRLGRGRCGRCWPKIKLRYNEAERDAG